MHHSKIGWSMDKVNFKIIFNIIFENSINFSPQFFTTYQFEFYILYQCQFLGDYKNDPQISKM